MAYPSYFPGQAPYSPSAGERIVEAGVVAVGLVLVATDLIRRRLPARLQPSIWR